MHLSNLLQSPPVRWQAPWLLPAVLGLVTVLAAAVLYFYPGQLRSVRRPWRYAIPALRMLAFTALSISIARPVALRARPVDDHGLLVVLVDKSKSMSIADGGRSPAELVTLAQSLGLLHGRQAPGESVVIADFEQIRALFGQASRTQSDLDYARVSGRGVEAAEARLTKQIEDLRQKGKALAASLTPASDRTLRERLSPLGDLPAVDLRGGWLKESGRRVDQAGEAVSRFRDKADRKLYDTDPEVKRVCDEVAQRTRLELAAEVLVRPGGLASMLGTDTQAMVFGFADRLTPLGVIGPADEASTRPASPSADSEFDRDPAAGPPIVWTSARLGLQADGGGTDLASTVTAAAIAVEGRNVRGVLVLSDGQQVRTESTAAVPPTSPLLPPGVPLIALSVAGPAAPKDRAVADVLQPNSAFLGETILVRARLRATGGLSQDPAALRLTVVGDDARQNLKPSGVDKPAGRREEAGPWAQFAVKCDHAGVQQIRIEVPPVEGEVDTENNRVTRRIKVFPERLHVAAIAGGAGWDFQYLRAALSRPEWFAVDSIILDPTGPKLALTPAQILKQDVLILYDVPVSALDREQWFAVDRLVRERGGSVVFIAGPSFNPASFIDQPLASSLLPFDFQADKRPAWRIWRSEKPSIKLLPGAEFARSDVLRLDDADTTDHRWQELSGVWKVLPVRAAKPGTRILLRDAETGLAVATEMEAPVGAGRAFYIGTHETWRWRLKSGEIEHDRFWRQLIRYAAEEPYAARSGRLALDLDRVSALADQPVQVRARIMSDEEARLTDATAATRPAVQLPATELLRAQVVKTVGGAVVREVNLVTIGGASGRLRGTISGLPPGDYSVRLNAAGANAAVAWPQVPLRIEAGDEAEMRNLSGDPDRLKRMAESTGGRLLRLDQFGAVPGLLAAAADDRPTVVEWSLWDSPWLFAFVVACFGAEWALRKRVGLS